MPLVGSPGVALIVVDEPPGTTAKHCVQLCSIWLACVGIYVTDGVAVRYHYVGTGK